MKDGILNINKPSGWTSQDVCAKLRHRLHIKKIGHTGTLDPMATGVLPVCIGKATRIIEYYDGDFKTYHAGMLLGTETDTLDIWGEVLNKIPVSVVQESGHFDDMPRSVQDDPYCVTEAELRKAFADYTGTVSQIPPKYSALKINGKRAYDLAREGKEFEIRPRVIRILRNEITMIDAESGRIEFDVTCSKGTYIRTICDDIGRTLGCGGVMTSLVRTKSGYFDISDALDLAELLEMSDAEIEKHIIPMDVTLTELGVVELNNNRLSAFVNGNSSGAGYNVVRESHFTLNAPIYKVYCSGEFLGTAYFKGRELIPAKVIAR